MYQKDLMFGKVPRSHSIKCRQLLVPELFWGPFDPYSNYRKIQTNRNIWPTKIFFFVFTWKTYEQFSLGPFCFYLKLIHIAESDCFTTVRGFSLMALQWTHVLLSWQLEKGKRKLENVKTAALGSTEIWTCISWLDLLMMVWFGAQGNFDTAPAASKNDTSFKVVIRDSKILPF